MTQLRIGVLYGGRSGEHEVSLASAAAVIGNLDPARYDPVPILVEKDGRWTVASAPPTLTAASDVIRQARLGAATPADRGSSPSPGATDPLAVVRPPATSGEVTTGSPHPLVTNLALDVVFPVLHGPCGEDGTVQGLLELANVPYVGAGVMASAVGMDKSVMKLLFAARGLPQVPYLVIRRYDWDRDRSMLQDAVSEQLTFPVFVKPANLGSSVGISKVKTPSDLDAAVALAASFDRKIIIEAAVPDAREIECAVLGNDQPAVSVPGEVIPSREFYDYEAKYIDSASELRIPAPLEADQVDEVQRLSLEAFLAIDGAGMARVDFLLARATRQLYVNELNTIPGFTTISMYAKLWAASGLAYPQLLDRLIELAIERHTEKNQLRTSVT